MKTKFVFMLNKRMNNTEGSVEVIKLVNELIYNEKEEIVINIDEIPITDELDKRSVDSGKTTDRYTEENYGNKSIDVKPEIKNENRNNADQQRTAVEMFDKRRKTPDVWVQFHEVKAKQIDVGRRSGRGGKNFQFYQDNPSGGGFNYNPESRNGFVMLVFAIVLVMLSLTFLYVVFVLNTPGVSDFYRKHRRPLGFLSSGVMIAMSYIMICCLPCVRVPPCNYVTLFIALAAMCNLAGVCTAVMKTQIVMFALLATSVTVAICLLLALSKFDFTAWYLYILVIGIVLMVLSVAISTATFVFGVRFRPYVLVLLYVLTLFQMIVLVMELQMIIGGKSIEISEEDYILAAYMLYTSIVNLFLQILTILADLESD